MKVLLVSSQITYVPGNYFDLFESVLEKCPDLIAGAAFIQNYKSSFWKDVAGLYWLGCPRVAGTLATNIFQSSQARRERILQAKNIPILRPTSMNEDSIIEWVLKQRIDLIVNVRTRCIYKNRILRAPRIGCINIHHGLLPDYRGTFCDLYALADNRPAGFTIHEMTEKVDSGRILLRRETTPGACRDYVSHLEQSGRIEGLALADLLLKIQTEGRLPFGYANESTRPIFTKNPDRKRIREFRSAGMIL